MGKVNQLPLYVLAILAVAIAFGETTYKNRIKINKKSSLSRSTLALDASYDAERAKILATKRRNLIQDIRRFIRESKSTDQVAELNLRLGGLYLEEYRAENIKAQAEYDEALEQAKNDPKLKAPKFDNSEAFAALDKARAIYRDLSTRYPSHPRRDEMLYFLALASLDRGQQGEGMSLFGRLLNEHPNSKYIPEALVQLADHAFEQNKFTDADTYYSKIIQRKASGLIPYAVYKKAWCAYNSQKPELALKQFRWVVENEENLEGTGTQVRVRQEALRDIALPFADLRLSDDAKKFFRAQGDATYRNGLEMMAALYFEAGAYPQAIEMNEALLEIDANHKKNPTYEIAAIESYRLKNDRPHAIERLFQRLPNYLKTSNWYEINSVQPEVVKQASVEFEELARKYALEFHGEAQKTKNDSLYKTARNLYAKYLDYFPLTTFSPQARFYLAEIQFREKEYEAAADNYYQVYKTPGSAANLRKEAIHSALQSLDLGLNADREKQGLSSITSKNTAKLKESDDANLEPTALFPMEAKFMEVSKDYLNDYPKAADAPDVLYQQAYLNYAHFNFVPAYGLFWKLTQTYSTHPSSYSSSFLILDILNRRKEYAKMVAACEKFLENKALNKESFRTEVADVMRKSELKRIALLEEKSPKEAADAYVEYTKAHGAADETLFEKALYNASVNYMKAGLLLSAVETQEKFLRRFPQSKFNQDMLLQVAKTYESLANFEKSASYFEQFATRYPTNTQSKTAWRLAGLYYYGAGNVAKAESLMLAFIKSYPQERKFVEEDLLDVYETRGANDRLIDYMLQARAQKGIPISEYLDWTVRIAELQTKSTGRVQPVLMDEGLKVANQWHKELKSTPRGAEAMAKIYFFHANQKEDLFSRIKLALPQRQLEINLQRKLQLLKELEKDYGSIASLGGEWGIGAIFRTAALYRQMSDEIAQAPVPADLTAEQLDLYRAELSKQMIKPFREKALGFSAQCLDKSQEYSVMAAWTAKCYSLAGELEPSRYPVVKTFYLPPYLTSVMMPNAESTKTLIGNYKNFRYPYASSALFQSAERQLASVGGLPSLYHGMGINFDETGRAVPRPMNYKAISDERRQVLSRALESEKPTDPKKISFAYLHLLRLTNPQRAVPSILEAIQRDPMNPALHNLLGLAYLDNGNLPAAKVVWLSLIARGQKDSSIWNNLAVLETILGNEAVARVYLNEAGENKEALTNLGFLALKYRNGFEAKRQFEKAIAQDSNLASAQVGYAVARIQNRELDSAKDALISLQKDYKSDPFAQISLAYFLVDSEKEFEAARTQLGTYVQQQNLENDVMFREALSETEGRRAPTTGDALPDIE